MSLKITETKTVLDIGTRNDMEGICANNGRQRWHQAYILDNEAQAEVNLNIPIYTMKDHLEGVKQIHELIASTGKENSFKVKPLKLGSRQTAAILCSSGTTGLPKGVCMSHESLLNINFFNISLDDKLLCYSTIYWISGVICLLQGTLGGCTRIITDQTFSAELFLRMVEHYNINIVFTPPSQMAMAVQSPDFKQRNLTSLEGYFCSGSAIPLAVVQAFSAHVKERQIFVGYGMTELSGACCFGVSTKSGDNGQLFSNLEAKIVDDFGKQLGIFKNGEICVRTPFKWSGYYYNQEATQAVYSEYGWLYSGDIGYFDDKGSLFLIDRKKDILKYNNFHFFPDVVEVCVCGIPDIISSFLPTAADVKVPNSKLTKEEVSDYVAVRMAHFKHLRGGVYFLNSLPKTASGKNIRAKAIKNVEALRNQSLRCSGLTIKSVLLTT